MSITLKEKSSAVRAKSATYSAMGVGVTALISAMLIIFGSHEFDALLLAWFKNNTILASFVLLAINTIITEIMKARANARAIKAASSKSYTVAAGAHVDDVILI